MKTFNFFSNKFLTLIICIHLLIKLIVAYFLEFGNDEVYYVKYVEHPNWSHFDHPIMVQLVGQISTLNAILYHHFFFRLSSVILSTISLIYIHKLVVYLYEEHAAKWSVILYLSSIYTSVIAGIFIMPDAVLSFFWILGIYYSVKFISEQKSKYYFIFSVLVACAVASKYQAIFLPFGLLLYIIFNNRGLLLKPYLYLGFFIMGLGLIPTLIWNINNDFISFTFHKGRVGNEGFSLDYFFREVFGEIFYNNPFSFGIFVATFIYFFRNKILFSLQEKLLLFFAFPLIIISVLISFGTETLPHWSALSYYSFMIISGKIISKNLKFQLFTKISLGFLFFIMIYGLIEINNGFIMNFKTSSQPIEEKGKNDFTQDTYGWQQFAEKFKLIAEEYPDVRNFATYGWYPASHIDFYVAKPLGLSTQVFGDYISTHEYFFIQNQKITPEENETYFFIESSNRGYKIQEFITNNFKYEVESKILDTIAITRRNDTIRYEYVYLIESKK